MVFLHFFCSVKPYLMSKSCIESKINVAKAQSSAPVQKKSSESILDWFGTLPKPNQLIGWSTDNIFTNFHDHYTCKITILHWKRFLKMNYLEKQQDSQITYILSIWCSFKHRITENNILSKSWAFLNLWVCKVVKQAEWRCLVFS